MNINIKHEENSDFTLFEKMWSYAVKEAVKEDTLPHSLFKYMNIDTFKGILTGKDNRIKQFSLKFDNYKNFNDQSECKFKLIENTSLTDWSNFIIRCKNIDALHALEESKSLIQNELITKNLESYLRSIIEKAGILCLSESCVETYMWAHYAKNSTGVCLEFDLCKDAELFTPIFKVSYDDVVPSIDYVKDNNWITKVVFHKSMAWSQEKEYRVMKANCYDNRTFKKESLLSVTFGEKTDNTKIQDIKDALLANSMQYVKLYQIRQKPDSYELERLKLND